ncbi:hypothetical protein [Massilia sp. TS11]|uniref:hypothetical protein n=1 Tax=Massilia sp. TS11 TaxID=2908003 RepID=UPI001EDB2E03|nr:hypothetical protein [Massilia sp. TS11]MCG2586238.1 hypothetical protein [Massilia sp. TS11]
MLHRFLACAVLALPLAVQAEPSLKDQQLADLAVARTDFVLRSQAYSMPARLKALALLDQAKARAGELSPAQFAALMARLAAISGNGHETFMTIAWSPAQRLPLRTVWFEDALLVTRTAPEQAELLGARITAVEGKPLRALSTLLAQHSGGPERYARWNAAWLYENPEMLHALGFAAAPDRLRLRLTLRDGRQVERTVATVDRKLVPGGMVNVMQSKSLSALEQEHGWRVANADAPEPLYLQEPDQWFRARELPELDALYLQFRANYDRDNGKTLSAFAEQWAKAIAAKPPRRIILDERFNTGGNSDLTMELMRVIGQQVREKVYILTSQYTFSAGIVSSALVKRHAGAKAVVVGSPVGDYLRWWSEGVDVKLPNSGQYLRYSTGLWDLQKGCAGESHCYGDKFDARVADLSPQLKAPVRASDWLAGRDPALEAITADIQKR